MKYSETAEGRRILDENQKPASETPDHEDETDGTPVNPKEPLEVAVANDSWEQGQEQIRLLRSIRCYVAWAFWLAVAPAIAVAAIYLAVLITK